jgi:hypothetical protein
MTTREKRRRKSGIPLSDEDERERKEQQTMKREKMKEKLINDVLLWKNKQYSRSQRIYWKTQPLNHPNKRSMVKIQKLQFLKSQYFEKVYSYDPFFYASPSPSLPKSLKIISFFFGCFTSITDKLSKGRVN